MNLFLPHSFNRLPSLSLLCCYVFIPQSLLELVFRVKVVITGDGFIPGERSVIIMNHRTRLDWMFLWCCLLRYSYLRLEKICLKAVLKGVPGFGESAQKCATPFFSPVRYTLCLKPHSDKLLKMFYFHMAPKPICDAYVYVPGWAMQVACFIFIKRRWAEDKEHMENMLDYFCDIREPLQLLLFPEGTDLTGETRRQDT